LKAYSNPESSAVQRTDPKCPKLMGSLSGLAKRQITWLRSMPDRVVVDAQAADAVQRVKLMAMQALTSGLLGRAQ
jgi:tRNA A37 N6-isopentenylltransferase MiaA